VSEKNDELTDDELEALRAERFKERVQRVFGKMVEEGVDFQAVPGFVPDGTGGWRIVLRIVPVDTRLQNHRPEKKP